MFEKPYVFLLTVRGPMKSFGGVRDEYTRCVFTTEAAAKLRIPRMFLACCKGITGMIPAKIKLQILKMEVLS